jgi:hypothetical protein
MTKQRRGLEFNRRLQSISSFEFRSSNFPRYDPAMTLSEFTASTSQMKPPTGLDPILQALWHDAKGDWQAAHSIAQSKEGTADYDRLHAYLHRKEGDDSNAGYWYRRAGAKIFSGTLEEEWKDLVSVRLAAAE